MALPMIASARGAPNVQYMVEIDASDVDRVIHLVEASVSGPSLERWLRGDATDIFHKDIESRFYEEGDVKSGFWAPLSEGTINIRRQLGYGPDPINRRTDEMFDFVTGNYPTHMGDGFATMDVPGKPNDPVTATKLETAQRGRADNPIPEFNATPPRPVLAVSEMDLARLLESLQVHVVNFVIGSLA